MLTLPNFTTIDFKQTPKKLAQHIDNSRQLIGDLLKQESFSWETLVAPLEQADDELNQFFSPVSHLNSVMSSDAVREAYNACLPLLTEYSTWVGQNRELYQAYQAIKDNEYDVLNAAQQKVIDNALRDFKLAGVALEGKDRDRYQKIQHRQSELTTKFEENLIDAADSWQHHVTDESVLSGLPETALAIAQHKAQEKSLDGWLLTLDIPCYMAVMTYADNRELREVFYRAYCTKGSAAFADGKWDNTPLMQEILALRLEEAQLLGFANYAEYSLATKMAESTDEVFGFLRDLVKPSKAKAQADFDELKRFANCDLESWDIAYYSEKLKQDKFQINDEELRPYFPLTKVLSGMFEIIHRLYGITLKPAKDVDTWHADVQFFELFDEDNNLRGGFYIDLFSRAKKRGGAWMDDCVVRRYVNSELQLPVAYLTCNFSQPVGDQPSLLTHDEVVTLFHETGHTLHHLLTQQVYADISGINGVPWDAVELPSQFFENWCWDKEAISLLSEHYQTGEPLPDAQLNQLLAAKNFQAAMQMLRQVEFSLYDFRLHQEFDPTREDQIDSVLNEVRDEVAVLKPPVWNKFQNGFSHIFAGGYSAGYYSYKWAEVLSADAFGAFVEEGIFNADTGRRFLHCVLEQGGSQAPADMFKAFRGREPQVEALLKQDEIL
tara:strand:- start:9069 stop:11060 length:1992 start_codon:yes stop_codon:yes gene_type:complete